MTLGVQRGNRMSMAGVCRIIACIQHNQTLTTVFFGHSPIACAHHDAWQREGLTVLPDEVLRRGWMAVLDMLRSEQVRNVGAKLQKLSRTFLHNSCYHRASGAASLTNCAALPRRVSRAERRGRLPRLWPPKHARASFSAACATWVQAVEALS